IDHRPFYHVNENVRLYFPTIKASKSGRRGVWYWVKILQYLRSNITMIDPVTVFSIPQGYSNLTIFALLGTNIPVFISDRNSPVKPLSFKSKLLRKIFYRFAAGIIAQTNFAKQHLIAQKIGNNNITVISNPLKKLNFYSSL